MVRECALDGLWEAAGNQRPELGRCDPGDFFHLCTRFAVLFLTASFCTLCKVCTLCYAEVEAVEAQVVLSMRSCRMCSRQKMRGIKWRCCSIWVQTAQDTLVKLCFSLLPVEGLLGQNRFGGAWHKIPTSSCTSFDIFARSDHGFYFSIHFRSSKRLFPVRQSRRATADALMRLGPKGDETLL